MIIGKIMIIHSTLSKIMTVSLYRSDKDSKFQFSKMKGRVLRCTTATEEGRERNEEARAARRRDAMRSMTLHPGLTHSFGIDGLLHSAGCRRLRAPSCCNNTSKLQLEAHLYLPSSSSCITLSSQLPSTIDSSKERGKHGLQTKKVTIECGDAILKDTSLLKKHKRRSLFL